MSAVKVEERDTITGVGHAKILRAICGSSVKLANAWQDTLRAFSGQTKTALESMARLVFSTPSRQSR